MKKNQKLFLTGLFLYLIPQSSTAQWQFPFPNAYGRLNLIQPNEVIGVGRFPTLNDVRARLHVNSFYLSLSSATTPVTFGEVFRTDATNAVDNTWQMWSGLTAATTTEKFRLFNPAGLNDIALQSSAGSMNFNTVGGIHRMIINGVTGNIGIGTNFTLPMNLVHQDVQHVIGVPTVNYHQFTNTQTGALTTDGFQIGINHLADPLNPGNFYSRAELRHLEDAPIVIYTNNLERFRITTDNPLGAAETRVGIYVTPPVNGFMARPLSALHIGNPWQQNAGTHRLWMDVGTYNTIGTDAMYIGLKNNDIAGGISSDHMGAVIAWGDNINLPEGADDMHILFSSLQVPASGDAGIIDALEVMRLSNRARVGIGNFTPPTQGNGSGIRPQRRLEIYDEHFLDIGSGVHFGDAPQLRLTYAPHFDVDMGINTDFQTTDAGNLFINPRNAGVNQFVGINTSSPGNTLEISSGNPATGSGREPSGLRFTSLNSASPIAFTTNGRVLTVDGNGDVVLANDDNSSEKITALENEILKLTARMYEMEKLLAMKN